MKAVFADTLYWLAVAKPGDPWAEPAKEAKSALGDIILVSTDEVLVEFLNALAKGGKHIRGQAVKMVRAILENSNVKIVPQSRDSFRCGLELYEKRGDKRYSFTDCVSMYAMRAEGLAEVLTNDHNFEQEGFTVLIEREP